MKNFSIHLFTAFVFTVLLGSLNEAKAQYCDSLVPSFIVDLSASPALTWTSPLIQRDGNCCGTVAPDNCLEFIITLNPNVIAVNFTIASGAVPPGALFYQIDCGPPVAVGSPICLSGPGPITLTFCKPGNNSNTFAIETYAEPIVGPDITLNAGCDGMLYANYYNEPTIIWTSVFPGPQGAYDNLLSCTAACDSTFLTAPINGPAYIDYVVCGMDIPDCDPNPICDTVRVTLIPPVDVSISSTATMLCTGQTATLTANVSGGSPPYSLVWSTGSTASSIVGGPGTYYVDVLDASGCYTATDTLTIIGNPLPAVVAGADQTVCEGTAVTLTATGASSYIWTNGVTNGVPFVQQPGVVNYMVTGTDANGCQNTDEVTVTVNPTPVVNAGPDQVICEDNTVTLSGTGASVYSWDGPFANGATFTPPVGTTTYTLTGTDVNGCVATDDVSITVNSLPVILAGPDMEICAGIEVTLTAIGASSYAWSNGITNGVPFTPAVGTTNYMVIGMDANGCLNTDEVNILVNPLPIVDAGPDQEVCEGIATTLSGSGAVVYSWDNGISDGVPFVQNVGTMTYTVTGTDANGCENTDEVTVIVNPMPVVNAGADQVICDGVYITLYSEGSSNLFWNNGVTNGVPFQPGVGTLAYVVTDEFSTGCMDSDTVIIEVRPLPDVWATQAEICLGDGVTLSAGGAQYYTWSGGVIDGVEFFPNVTDTYTVSGTDDFGCTSTAEALVIVHYPPVVNFTIDDLSLTTSESMTGFDNLTTGAVSYSWDFGDGTGSSEFEPVHTFPTEQAGEYSITLTAYSEFGCYNDYTKFVHVFQDYSIYVPNAFTPDANGVNEIFKPVMYGFDENDFVMFIYNRWGELIFETHNMDIGWDGYYAGQDFHVQDGVYTWKIEARIKETADTKIFMGHLNLIK